MVENSIDSFKHLLQEAHIAYIAGEPRRARNLLTRAAILRPTEEAVWEALLPVVESEADHLVCLHNLAVINPQRHLHRLEPFAETVPIVHPTRHLKRLVGRGLYQTVVLVEIAVIGLFAILAFVLIWYI